MKYIWITAIFIILFTTKLNCNEITCDRFRDVCHSCEHYEEKDEFLLECKNNANYIQINIVLDESAMLINCNPNVVTDFSLLPNLKNITIENIKLRGCRLPDRPLIDVFDNIDLKSIIKVLLLYHIPNMTSFKSVHLKGLTNLTKFEVQDKNTINLRSDLFEGVTNLQTLSLKSKNLYLYPDSFRFLTKLKTLIINRSNVYNFTTNIFKELSLLENLSLWHLKIDPVFIITSDAFDGLYELIALDLHGDYLSSLPFDAFKNLSNLKEVYLSKNSFESLPENLFKRNGKLEIFEMNYNKKLTTLPDKLLSNLSKLTNVTMQNCRLKFLPYDLLSGSHNIKAIMLKNNYLENITSNTFRDQTALTLLDLENNNISFINNDAFQTMTALKTLNLNHNKLTFISRLLFQNLQSLKELTISNNNLKYIRLGAFSGLRNIETIDLSNNKLVFTDYLPNNNDIISPFENLDRLKTLNLTNNSITKLRIFRRHLLNCNNLELRNNNISEIEFEDLYFLPNGITIDLSDNNINIIDFSGISIEAIDTQKKKNITVCIENNPLNCDCKLYDFVRYLQNSILTNILQTTFISKSGKYRSSVDMKCLSPEKLKGKYVEDVDPNNLYCTLNNESSNDSNNCKYLKRGNDQDLIIDCSSSITIIPIKPPNLDVYSEIWIQNSSIRSLSELFSNKSDLNYIKVLNASYNNLTHISIDDIPENVEILDLSHNHIEHFDSSVIDALINKTTLKDIRLSDNPFECNCDLITFISKIYKKVNDRKFITCNDGVLMDEINIEKVCETRKIIIALCVAITLSCILIGVLSALYYKYEHEIKVWLYAKRICLWCISEKEIDEDKVYDAFLSFSHEDEDFVANQLLPELESGPCPFKICIHLRDWVAGEYIAEQISRSVQDSKRTIVVLSPSFLKSVWGITEFKLAHSRAIKEGRVRVIIILYGDIVTDEIMDDDLKLYLSTNTYVKWGDTHFWNKLKYSLPHKNYPDNSTMAISNDNLEMIPL